MMDEKSNLARDRLNALDGVPLPRKPDLSGLVGRRCETPRRRVDGMGNFIAPDGRLFPRVWLSGIINRANDPHSLILAAYWDLREGKSGNPVYHRSIQFHITLSIRLVKWLNPSPRP